MSKKRVVITGLGIISSIGIGKTEFWENLIAGKSGIDNISAFDTSRHSVHKGGEVKNFQPEKYIKKGKSKSIGRASQFAVVATKLSLEDANLDIKKTKRIGAIIGTTMADAQSLEQIDKHWIKEGEDDVWASNIRKYPGYNLSDNISFYFNLQGLNFVIPTACAAGNYSIGFSFDLIRSNQFNIMIAGGADPIARTNFTGFNRLVAMAPEKCQPFDKNRKGMIVGEGAGVLILEELEFAKKRGAHIYAEILGYGLSCDAYHMSIPSLNGIKKVMTKTLRRTNVKPEEVDYISAHGTGTVPNDKTECQAIKEIFGERHKEISVSSIKSALGHTMGAASAIEAIVCCMAIEKSIIPPTINYETPDVECDIDCTPNKAKQKEVNIALNNSFAFGGNNACLVLRKI